MSADRQPEVFASVCHSIWWAIVTLTTVGYGDTVPITLGGRLCTAAVLVAEIGFVAVPTGLIASAMAKVHEEDRAQDRLPPPAGACLSPCSRLNGPKRPRV